MVAKIAEQRSRRALVHGLPEVPHQDLATHFAARRGRRVLPASLRFKAVLAALLPAALGCAPSSEEWAGRLSDPDPFQRAMAAVALGEAPPRDSEIAVRALVDCLDTGEPAFRTRVLGALSKQAAATLPVLAEVERTRIRGSEAREEGLREALAQAHDRVVPILAAGLGETAREEDDLGLALLPYVGAAAVDAVAVRLCDPRARTRARAARVLGEIGLEADPALLALVDRLTDQDPAVVREAEEALDRIAQLGHAPGPSKASEDPCARARRIAWMLNHADAGRRKMAEALLCRDGETAARALIEDLDGADIGAAHRALRGLTVLLERRRLEAGPPCENAAGPSVGRALDALRIGAADTRDAERALPALVRALGDEQTSVRCCAALAIARLGPAASSAAPLLSDIAARGPGIGRVSAQIAIERIRGR